MEAAFVIETRKPGSLAWFPIGVINTTNALVSGNVRYNELIKYVKDKEPRLLNFEIRLRIFRRIPGVYTEDERTGEILVLTDKLETEGSST